MGTEALSLKSDVAADKQALADIYERYSPDIFRYAWRQLNDNELAEDCVSETFHRFLIAVRRGTPVENVRAFLYRVAHNVIVDYYRRRPPTPAILFDESLQPNPDGNPSQLVAQEMDRQRVRAALLRLSPDQRLVIELRFMENWSHNEVADVLGRSVEATRALQYRAVEALRQLLSE